MRGRWIAGILLLALLAAGWAIWQARAAPSRLPDFDEAEYSSLFPDAPPLRWSGDRAGELRAIFGGIPRDRSPMKWAVQGNLKLFRNGEPAGEITVFSPSGGLGPFRIGENYFLGYDPAAFRAFLEKNAG